RPTRRSWGRAGAAAITVAAALTVPSVPVRAATAPYPLGNVSVRVAGSAWRVIPSLTAAGTTFVGTWYLQQLLRAYGLQSTWDGNNLRLLGFPAAGGRVWYNNQLLPGTESLAYGSETYIDLSAIARRTGGAVEVSTQGRGLDAAVLPLAAAGFVQPPVLLGKAGQDLHLAAARPALGAGVGGASPTPTGSGSAGWSAFNPAGGLWLGNSLWGRVPVVYQGGTSYIGLWYVQRFLASQGIATTWDGRTFNIQQLPQVNTGVDVRVNGLLVGRMDAIHYNGDWYVPATSLISVGWQVDYDPVSRDIRLQAPAAVPVTPVPANAAAQVSTLTGVLQFSGLHYNVQQVSLRNVRTHAHYYAQVLPDGSFSVPVPDGQYEVFAILTDGPPVYLLQPFTVHGDTSLTVSVPALPQSGSITSTHAVVRAGDNGVAPADLLSVDRVLEAVYGEVAQWTGMALVHPVQVTVYSTQDAYQQHFQDEGYAAAEASTIASQSVAVEEGKDQISVQMPALNLADRQNILAHELTHALLAEHADEIPSWLNEGLAWEVGLRAELDGSTDPVLSQGVEWQEWTDVVTHWQQGDLQPLGQADPLDSAYNVELQDDFAVHQLLERYGWSKVMQFVQQGGGTAAFAKVFGVTFDTFTTQVNNTLASIAGQTDAGVRVRLQVMPDGPQQIYVIGPDGRAVWIAGLQSGQAYDLLLRNDGSVVVPGGLTEQPATGLPAFATGTWTVGAMAVGTGARQEFELGHAFATPYLIQALLYSPNGTVVHAYPATAVPLGLAITDLQPVAVDGAANTLLAAPAPAAPVNQP
ncbi:MAG: hypothetical protein K6T26_06435, partial [Alicyclobacillus sp.]|nr:hypothetical protein [Alicyclobacillus sp.]